MGYWDEYRKHGIWGGSDIPKHSAEINQVKGALNAIGISIDQYIGKRNDNVYIYSEYRAMCNNDDIRYYYYSTAYTNICSDRPTVSEFSSSVFARKFNKCYTGKLEPINN